MHLGGQFLRFCLVGGAGFIVDVGVLYLLRDRGIDLYSARVVSFLAAATFTWIGNRWFTFRSGRERAAGLHAEWFRYVLAMVIGGGINYGVYALAITWLPVFRQMPWLAVAAGTSAGLMVNFVLARRILYRPGAD